MLTEKEMANNKEVFKTLLLSEDREGLEEFFEWLEGTDFFTAPASTRFHGNYEGGLCQHSLNVYVEFKRLDDLYQTHLRDDSIAICALLHDVCKANFYKKGTRNVKDEFGRWTTKEVWEIDDKIPLGHGEKSCMLIQRFMRLNIHELLAIRWHMGGFDTAVKGGDYSLSKAQSMTEFVTLLHIADMIATNLIDVTEEE